MLKAYIAFDIETTGLNPAEHEVIEIGALKVRDGKVAERFMEFIKPNLPVTTTITNLTGITNEMVSTARTMEQVIPDFLDFCEDDILIGHNVLFDYGFIKTGASALGRSFEKTGIDTLKIAKKVHKDFPSRSLGTLCEHYGIQNMAAHRAYHDALATAKIYQCLAHYYEEKEPLLFRPSPLLYVEKKSPPATPKQVAFLMRLIRQRKLAVNFNEKNLTRDEASRLIDGILSGSQTI